MQNLKPLLADWILAPKTLTFVKGGIIKVRNYIKYATFLKKNEQLRDLFKGQRCFVIGNGPSINRQDLSLLKPEIKIVCNSFFNHEILEEWQPTIYCAGDPASSHSIPASIPYYQDIFRNIDPLFYIFHSSVLEQILNNDEIQIPYALRDKILGFASHSPLYEVSEQSQIDFTKSVPGIRHTPMLSIMTAMYMGCNPIILIGCDHDYGYKYFRGEYEVEHFYQESNPQVLPSDWTYLRISQEMFKTYACYNKLNQIALNQGISIFDATNGGFLDTFKKVDYSSLF